MKKTGVLEPTVFTPSSEIVSTNIDKRFVSTTDMPR